MKAWEVMKHFFVVLALCFLDAIPAMSNAPNQQTKTAVFIVGPGRCGGSCTTGVLNCMGLYLNGDLRPPNNNNPKGFFEHMRTMDLNDKILENLGTSVNDPDSSKPDLATPLALSEKKLIKEHLQKYFGQEEQFGVKDGRIALLLPLYVAAAQELGFSVKIIAVWRDPEEIARSYFKFNGSPVQETLVKVHKRYALIEQYATMYEIMVVRFEDLLKTPHVTVNAIQEFLPFLKSYEQAHESIEAFLDINLKHENH